MPVSACWSWADEGLHMMHRPAELWGARIQCRSALLCAAVRSLEGLAWLPAQAGRGPCAGQPDAPARAARARGAQRRPRQPGRGQQRAAVRPRPLTPRLFPCHPAQVSLPTAAGTPTPFLPAFFLSSHAFPFAHSQKGTPTLSQLEFHLLLASISSYAGLSTGSSMSTGAGREQNKSGDVQDERLATRS